MGQEIYDSEMFCSLCNQEESFILVLRNRSALLRERLHFQLAFVLYFTPKWEWLDFDAFRSFLLYSNSLQVKSVIDLRISNVEVHSAFPGVNL